MRKRRLLFNYLMAPTLIVAAYAVRAGLSHWIEFQTPLSIYLLAVILTAFIGGFGPGFLATILAVSTATLLSNDGPFDLQADTIRMGLFFVQGLIVSVIFERLRRSLKRERDQAATLENAFAQSEKQREALRISEASNRLMLEKLPGYGICRLNADGRFTSWNSGIARLLGYGEAEFLTLGLHDLLPADERVNTRCIIGELIGQEQPFARWYARADGSPFWGLLTLCPWDEPNSGYAMILSDGTELKKAEIAAQTASEDAMAARSEFLAQMSHELRTPLNAMVGFTDLLLAPNLSASEQRRYLATLRRNGQALARLVDDLLDLSKAEAGRISIERLTFALSDLLHDVLELMENNAREKGIALRLIAEGDFPLTLLSDPTRIRQILLNLISNAIKFTHRGSVTLELKVDGDQLRFLVKDTGRGIAPEAWPQLFRAFSQGDETIARLYGGTGLGLALSRELAELLDGTLELCSSQLGIGSEFCLSLPIDGPTAMGPLTRWTMAETEAPRLPATPRLEGLRVLLVEDAPDNQLLIERLLSLSGIEVEIAADGREGVRKALAQDWDLVLMDMQMPLMDGYEATQTLRDAGYDKPIIALSAHTRVEERARSLSVGCDDHIDKPVSPHTLMGTIARHTDYEHTSR